MFGELSKWLLIKRSGEWFLDPPEPRDPSLISWHKTFVEAHAAYLDAVTCEKTTPFSAITEGRCSRAKGHEGMCLFPSLHDGAWPLRVNYK